MLMDESVILDGRVRTRQLPLLDVPPGPDAPPLRRLDLAQGELAVISPADVPMRFIAWMEFREGAVRGNHYHLRKQEWFYVTEGEVELVVEDRESKERHRLRLGQGDLAVIEPGVGHAVLPLQSGHGLEYSPIAYDPADTIAYELI